jgi:hypothetical protein
MIAYRRSEFGQCPKGNAIMADTKAESGIEMDGANLYVEESFTDRRVGNLQRLSPVKKDGTPDPARAVLYLGQTQVLTPAGALPLSFEIEAGSLDEAIAKFGKQAQQALNDTLRRLEELRREQASSLIVPGGASMPGPRGGRGGLQIP